MVELIEGLEAAAGPSTKLDEMIVVALSGQDPMDFDGPWDAPAYTASLDAAMTLIPEGADWMADNFDGPHDRRCTATIYAGGPGHEASGSSPALALCIAALRARALSSDARDGQGEG